MTEGQWRKGLAAAHARQADMATDKLRQVRRVVQEMLDDPDVPPEHINVHRITRRADSPSHEFVAQHSGRRARQHGYDHDLAAEIAEAREAKRRRLQSATGSRSRRHDSELKGLHAMVQTYRHKVESLRLALERERAQLSDARHQLKLALGAQLDEGLLIDPEQHEQLRNHVEGLRSQNSELARQLERKERRIRDANETVRALEAANRQLGDELRGCTCQQGVVRL